MTTRLHLAPRLKKEQSYTSTALWVFMASSGVNSTFTTKSRRMRWARYVACMAYIQSFGGEIWRDRLEDLAVHERIILKMGL